MKDFSPLWGTDVAVQYDGHLPGGVMRWSIWSVIPGEMDLMARIAGLRLVARYANWQRTPFDTQSVVHVSVYGPANPA